MEQITWRDLKPRRREMGLTRAQMAKRCGIEDVDFLALMEDGEIETTSSAIMACIAAGYEFKRAQCVGMVAHWSPHWPQGRFMRRGRRGSETQRKPAKRVSERVSFRHGVMVGAMQDRGLTVNDLHHRTGMDYGVIYNIVLRRTTRTLSMEQVRKLCAVLGLEPWELSEEIKREEETNERTNERTTGDSGAAADDQEN